jgi:2-dehydropantoate 2-reductase
MRIAVVGIGGVGGYYGGKLALAYAGKGEHEVVFVARREHLQTIREKGLCLMTPEGERLTIVPTLATDRSEEIGTLDFVLFCTKSYGLEEAARMIAGNVHSGTVVLPLLNGVNISERLRKALPGCMVLNGCVYIGSSVEGPGVVHHKGGSGQLFFGPDRNEDVEKFRYLEDLLRGAGIKADLVEDIAVQVWTKYIFVGPFAGITSLRGKTFGAVLDDDEDRRMLQGLMAEIGTIARAKGIHLPADIVEESLRKGASFPYATKTSMQLDYEKGRATETDIFMEYIVNAGKELGIATPIHEEVYRGLMKKR